MLLHIVQRGIYFDVGCLERPQSGRRPAEEFMDALSEDEKAVLAAVFQSIGGRDHGQRSHVLKKLSGTADLWEIKRPSNIRIFYFWFKNWQENDRRTMVLTDGVERRHLKRRHTVQAQRMKKQFLQHQKRERKRFLNG